LIEQLSLAASDPADFFTQLNRAYSSVFTQTVDMMLATALYMVIDTQSGQTLCCSAGHPSPFLLRRNNNSAELLSFSREIQGPGLGLYPTHTYRNLELRIEPHDLLLLYTDGLSDVMDPQRRFYDVTRMPPCLAENVARPAAELLREIMSDAQKFSARDDFEDDLCLLAVEIQRLR